MQKVYLKRHIGENTFVYFRKSNLKRLYPVLSHDYSFRWYTNPPTNQYKYRITDKGPNYYQEITDEELNNIYKLVLKTDKLDIYKLGIPKTHQDNDFIKLTRLLYNPAKKEIIYN